MKIKYTSYKVGDINLVISRKGERETLYLTLDSLAKICETKYLKYYLREDGYKVLRDIEVSYPTEGKKEDLIDMKTSLFLLSKYNKDLLQLLFTKGLRLFIEQNLFINK